MTSACHLIDPISEITKHFSLGVMVSAAAMSTDTYPSLNHTPVDLIHFHLLIILGRQ